MDNIAHTLVGAALGRAVADRKVPGAGWIGAIAGNAPDWSELLWRPGGWAPRSGPGYLEYHRGVTHSFLGALVEIAVLTGVVGLILQWRERGEGTPGPRWRWIAACVAVTVASHLYLDWQGSYGLRPFLPWSGRWYYADWVAIVDPFFWVVPLIALAWGARRHWVPALGYLLALGGVVIAVVVWPGRTIVVLWVRLAVVGLAAAAVVGWTRHWFGVAGRRRAAAYAVAVLAAYATASGMASRMAQAGVRAAAMRRFGPDASWAALTVVGRPFHWEPIWASADSVAGPDWAAPRNLDRPAVRRALGTPEGRVMAQFARFLAADVDSSGGALRVYLRDARFRPTGRGPGWAAVEVRLR
ncbi:MAG TPA: metal-dependent hydrolase [Gemmatimonadales bacterium]|jgi:inner membrane protein|nr:metal-dependent hydrolase [Gemmatimonadales bacterium]